MTCREFDEFVMDYLGDELPAETRMEFDRHMSLCPPCVAFLQDYQKTIEIGKIVCAHPEDPVPDAVPEELIRAILSSRVQQS